MKKQSSARPTVETLPALLRFRCGDQLGIIYAHRRDGRIVEAYRGYGYGYEPIASALRSNTVAQSEQ